MDAKDRNGKTPLEVAMLGGHAGVVHKLQELSHADAMINEALAEFGHE